MNTFPWERSSISIKEYSTTYDDPASKPTYSEWLITGFYRLGPVLALDDPLAYQLIGSALTP